MANEVQGNLFTSTPDREYQKSSIRTWKDEEREELLEQLQVSSDELDRRDAQARQTIGQDALEAAGVPPRRAAKIMNARMAKHIVEQGIQERAAQAAAEKEERRQKELEKLSKLLRS